MASSTWTCFVRLSAKLFPSLFVKHDISDFKCGVCEMAKSHRTSFPPSLNKSSIPFMIIHSNVWGPSKATTLGGAHCLILLLMIVHV